MKSAQVDILVIGAGVLGVTLSYWLSSLYDCSIALADLEKTAAMHTTSRNTGVIHRPFYLDPRKKSVFARSSLLSHPMWKSLAQAARLPWKPIGTLNVAVENREIKTLEKYEQWGVQNGMEKGELELLDGRSVRSLEPELSCKSALLSRTDVSVDFGMFTRYLWKVLLSKGAMYLGGHRAVRMASRDRGYEVEFEGPEGRTLYRCRLLVNAAGGGALGIAHDCGLALAYASLNFRGEYWVVDEPFASKINSNIYRPPKFPQYPFLDPHFVVRSDGTRQIGPNAVLVPDAYVYRGMGLTKLPGFLSHPVLPKAKLIANADFLSLVLGEWRSSMCKGAMCERVRKFVPSLDSRLLNRRAVFGVRSSVVDKNGFVPEALLLTNEASAHIINFNSPGATGAPSFSAMSIAKFRFAGLLDGFRSRESSSGLPGWDFQTASSMN